MEASKSSEIKPFPKGPDGKLDANALVNQYTFVKDCSKNQKDAVEKHRV